MVQIYNLKQITIRIDNEMNFIGQDLVHVQDSVNVKQTPLSLH